MSLMSVTCLVFWFSILVLTSGCNVKSGPKYSKYSGEILKLTGLSHQFYHAPVYGNSLLISVSSRREVSYVQQRATFLIVYPPPPSTNVGILNDFTYLTQSLLR